MINERTTFKLEIPHWENKVKVGVAVKKYFEAADSLPQKYQPAKTRRAGKKVYFVDSKNKRIVKNGTKVGKPVFWRLNGQHYYSNTMTWKRRTLITKYYHKYFKKYITDTFKEPFPSFLAYKINMHIEIHEVFTAKTPDITNMWILAKLFEDAVVTCGILRDDSPEYRRMTSYEYIFVPNKEDRKLVITFNYKQYKI